MKQFDVAVVGGGMVGAASALSLAQLGLTVAIIEKQEPATFSPEQPYDLRVSAISLASEQLLERLGAWQCIKGSRVCPYRRLGVWETEQSYTEFNSDDINQSHLGHIIENRLIQLSLWQQIKQESNITLFCPESVLSVQQDKNFVQLTLSKEIITARLLIAADGANSQVREMVGIGLSGWDYKQAAMLIHVETEADQQDITWQQFTPSGPVAMLPLNGKQASLVWYNEKSKITELAKLTSDKLESKIMAEFPAKLGKCKVINKASFPLTRRHANSYQSGRVLLLGDAAHTINPLAGQGVNLGFKDVAALQMVIANSIGEGRCWHELSVFAEYEKSRRMDNQLMMTAMDAFYFGFSNKNPLVKLVRNSALFIANRSGALKNKALEYACGIK